MDFKYGAQLHIGNFAKNSQLLCGNAEVANKTAKYQISYQLI